MTTSWSRAGQSSALASFELDIQDFEGPLDLLLHLIEKQGLDITGVSLLAVTDQFVEHAHQIREHYAEAASEFLLVASQLALLKSRALLPQPEPDEENEESLDDIAERLRLYAAFKAVAHELDERLQAGTGSFIRVAPLEIEPTPPKPGTGDLSILMAALSQLVQSNDPEVMDHATPTRRFHVADKIDEIGALLSQHGSVPFDDIASTCSTRAELIAAFLAVLHLVQQRAATVNQPTPFSPIILEATSEHD